MVGGIGRAEGERETRRQGDGMRGQGDGERWNGKKRGVQIGLHRR